MELMKLSGDEWRTLVVIPAVVSLAINLCTPVVQRAATSLLVKSARHMHGGMNSLLRLRIRQINTELAEFQKLSTSHSALLEHYRMSAFFMSWGLWMLLLSPVVAMIAQALAFRYAHLLPWVWGELFVIPGAAFAAVIGTMFAAGPFQATLYSSFLQRKLKQIATDPTGYIFKLEMERTKIEMLLPNPQNNE